MRYVTVMAHAYSCAEVLRRIELLEDTLKHHLIKLLVCDDYRNKKHWTKEVQHFLAKIRDNRLKGNAKISKEIFYDILYDNNSYDMPYQLRQRVSDLLEDGYPIVEKYRDPNYDWNVEIKKLEDFYQSLSLLLERKYAGRNVEIVAEQLLEDAHFWEQWDGICNSFLRCITGRVSISRA